MNKHYRKGDCAPRLTPPAGHPWRRAIVFWAAKAGRYRIDAKRIATRRGLQRAAARYERAKEARHASV